MTTLKDAFASLSAIDYSALPSDKDAFLKEAFRHAEAIVNSIPPQPNASSSPPTITSSTSNSARKATDTVATPHMTAIDSRNESMHKAWGSPVKVNQKDNPLGITIHKMAGFDKFGAWFARRSIHQGLGFTKWKRAWQSEFLESLKVKGGPGAGAVRGITADRRVESHEIKGVGELEVWQLSAQFPGPVAPREFVELLITSESALSNASALGDTSSGPLRHMMVISRPTTHPDAPHRDELVRGTYESVEIIREITIEGQDPELNPIEWIMVTRSDPGGGIPRFMVERGTPGGVVADTAKFLNWACPRDDFAEDDDGLTKQRTLDEHNPPDHKEIHERHRESISQMKAQPEQPGAPPEDFEDEQKSEPDPAAVDSATSSGILGSAINAAAAYLPNFMSSSETNGEAPVEDLDSSPLSRASSTQSFMSADDGSTVSPNSLATSQVLPAEQDQNSIPIANRSRAITTASTTSNKSETPSLAASLIAGQVQPNNSHEKEIIKLHRKTLDLDEKATKAREADESKTSQLDASISDLVATTAGADDSRQQKWQKERDHHVKKAQERQEKHLKEREKLQEKISNEQRKAEEKRKKEADEEEKKRKKEANKDELAKMKRERDEAVQGRKHAELEIVELKKEMDVMRKEIVRFKARLEDSAGGVTVVNGATNGVVK